MFERTLQVAFACGLMLASNAIATPKVEGGDDEHASVLLRNIYVPVDNTASWPTNGEAYLPLAANRLEELLATANRDKQPAPQVIETQMYGSLEESGVIIGFGGMHVRPLVGQSWLSFPTGDMRLSNLEWRLQRELAQLGYWGAGRGFGLTVDREDWMDFEWSATPSTLSSTLGEYRTELPAALANTMVIDLPDGVTPDALAGSAVQLIEQDATSPSDAVSKSILHNLPTVPAGRRRWLLRSAPAGQLTWKLRGEDEPTGVAQDRPAYREQIHYRLSGSGIEVTHQIDFCRDANLPATLTIDAPDTLVLRTIQWNSQPTLPLTNSADGIYEITVPTGLGESLDKKKLVVRAWHPLQMSSQVLPRIELASSIWLSGSVEVDVDPSLKVVDIRPRNVALVDSTFNSQSRQLRFEKLGSRFRVDLSLTRDETPSVVRLGRVIDLNTTDMKASVYAHLTERSPTGVRVVSAQLIGRWRPRTVVAELPYAVDDWYETVAGGKRRLVAQVSLVSGADLPDNTPLRLEIEADAPASEGWLPVDQCDVLRFEHAMVSESLITFRVADDNQLEWNPPPIPLVEDAVMPQLGTLLPATIAADVYDRTEVVAGSRLYVKPANPELDVMVTTTVADEGDRWTVGHRLDCTTLRGSIERLELRAAGAATHNWRWRLDGDDSWQPVADATNPSDQDQAIARDAGCIIELPTRQVGEFVLLIRGDDVPSATCSFRPIKVEGVEVTRQFVEVGPAQAGRLDVLARGWQLTESNGGSDALHSRWTCNLETDEPLLSVSRTNDGGLPLAIITRASLDSVYIPNAPSQHRFRFVIDSSAETSLRCVLPGQASSVTWRRVDDSIDNLIAEQSAEFSIPLIPGRDAEQLEVAYVMNPEPLHHGYAVEAPWPKMSVSIARGTWNVSYPPSYRVNVAGNLTPHATWKQRLFGPLATRPGTNGALRSMNEIEIPIDGLRHAPARLTLHYDPTSTSQYSLALVAAIILGYWSWKRPTWLVTALAVASFAALTLPVPVYAWATAAWGGLLGAVAIRSLEVSNQASLRWSAGADRPMAAASTVGIIFFAIGLVGAPAVADDTATTRIQSVLIPTDADGRVANDQRFITPQLLAELLRREAERAPRMNWVASSPRFVGHLPSKTLVTSGHAQTWEFAFDLRAYGDDMLVELPIRQADADWDEKVRIDGVPMPLIWNPQGDMASFRVRRAGEYRVRLNFHPTEQTTADRVVVSLNVPPLPGGRIALTGVNDVDDLRVNERAISSTDETTEPQVFPLANRSQVTVAWRASDSVVNDTRPTAALWEWIEVSTNRATIDIAVRIGDTTATPPPLELQCRGQTLSMSNAAAAQPTGEWRMVAMNNIEVTDDGAYLARYRLEHRRPHTYGRIRIPHLKLSGFTISERHVAVTHDEQLNVLLSGEAILEYEAPLAELASYWPNQSVPQQMARIDPASDDLRAAVRPVISTIEPNETLDVCCLDQQLEIAYRGTFGRRPRPRFVEDIHVSPELTVADVQLITEGTLRPIEFARPEPGRLVVFFDTPVQSSYELLIRGMVPLVESPTGADVMVTEVPRITAASQSGSQQQVSVYAVDHLAVEIADVSVGPKSINPISDTINTQQAYCVGSFLADSMPDEPVLLHIATNRPQFDTRVVSRILRQDGVWIAEFGVLVEVLRDTLPEVVLNWPEDLTEEVEIDTTTPLAYTPVVDPARRQIQLRFGQSATAGKRLIFTVRSSVRTTATSDMVCPIVGVQNARRTRRYFALTDYSDGSWTRRGLRTARDAARIDELISGTNLSELLESTVARPQVRWVADPAGDTPQRIPLVNIEVYPSTDGAITLRTQLVLLALDRTTCDLVIPSGQTLAEVLVDGRPAVVNGSDGKWTLSLPDPAVPHFVEFVTHRPAAMQSDELHTPTIEFDGDRCLATHRVWSVCSVNPGMTINSTSAEALPTVEVAALRLSQMLTACASAWRRSSDTQSIWARKWVAELQAAEQSLRTALESQTGEPPRIVDAIPEADEYSELLARAAIEIGRKSPSPNKRQSAPSGQPLMAQRPSETMTLFVQSIPGPLQWTTAPSDPSSGLFRWLLALLSVAVATTYVARQKDRPTIRLGYELVFPVVIVVGLLWWLCLWPRILGLLLAVAAVLAWLRWKRLAQANEKASS